MLRMARTEGWKWEWEWEWKRKTRLWAFASVCVLAGVLGAEVASCKGVYVHPTEGRDEESCGLLGSLRSCRTLGAAYERLEEGDTMFLGPGVYNDTRDRAVGDLVEGARVFTRSGVFIVPLGEGLGTRPVIDLRFSGPLFDFKGVRDVTLRGLVIRNGSGSRGNQTALARGGCLSFENSENIYLQDVDFEGCRATGQAQGEGRGGAVYAENTAALIFRDCAFRNTYADFGGAAFVTGSHLAMTDFEGCSFLGTGAGRGGGVVSTHTQGGQTTFENCTFSDTSAGLGLGGVILTEARSVNRFHRCRFENPRAGLGGVAHVAHNTLTLLSESSVTGSLAQSGGGSVFAAGEAIVDVFGLTATGSGTVSGRGGFAAAGDRSQVVLRDVSIAGATAEEGGALHLAGESFGRLLGVHIRNASAKGTGGALHSEDRSLVELDRVVLEHCSAEKGGGAFFASQNVTANIFLGTFVGNQACFGSAIFTSARLTVANASFAGNNARCPNDADHPQYEASGTIYVKEGVEGAPPTTTTGRCDFFERSLNITHAAFAGNRVDGCGAGIFWDPSRDVRGLCSPEDLGRSLVATSPALASLGACFFSTSPQTASVQQPEALSPGVPFDLRVQVKDALGQDVGGYLRGGLPLTISSPGEDVRFQDKAAFHGSTDFRGTLVAGNVVAAMPPHSRLVLEVHSPSLPWLAGSSGALRVGGCPEDQSYSPPGRVCLPLCDESYYTAEVGACSSQGGERTVTYAWIEASGGRGKSSSPKLCAGGLDLPRNESIGCWFVSSRSLLGRCFLGLAGTALAAHLIALAALVACRNRKRARMGQPLLVGLLLLGNLACLSAVFAATGKPSGPRCTLKWLLISAGFVASYGSLVLKAQTLGHILGNGGLEKPKRAARRPGGLLFLACLGVDLALHVLAVAAAGGLGTDGVARRRGDRGDLVVQESRCSAPGAPLALALGACKLVEVMAGAAAGARVLWGLDRRGAAFAEARLVGLALFQVPSVIAAGLGAAWAAAPTAGEAYWLLCGCILLCTGCGFCLGALPAVLGGAREMMVLVVVRAQVEDGGKDTTWSSFASFFTARSEEEEEVVDCGGERGGGGGSTKA
ncbi:hypothetical protein HOP50_15g76430 [Chloropicon primus]|nr:hypothetical protein HOP50_15g76430 [Chloropicon primus]